VPRWLSEGLSVFEERRARPSWGADATVEFLAAYKGGAVRKASELSEGFVHARYPQELQFSYYMASLVCEMIYAERGSAGLVAMLSVYKQGLGTPVVFQRVLGTSMDAFDKKFDAWVKARFAVPLKSIDANNGHTEPKGDYVRGLVEGAALVEREEFDSAKTVLEHDETLFPDYAGAHSPAWYLAQIALRRGDAKTALAQIARITTQNETAWEANEIEVRLRDQLEDRAGAAAALERMIWIWPLDPSIHEHLAEVATQLGDHRRAVRERRAILALNPSDRMEARYQLAKALQASGDIAGARREILGVLEQAPSFDKALKLLLELRKQTPEGRSS
jgi:tetratricopeptide (TPR) repeat protein